MKKRKPLRQKSIRKTTMKTALDVAEQAWKDAVKRRAKGICEVHGEACQGAVMQADHFRTRTHKWTFLMVENGTYVCAGLNQNKAWGVNNAAEQIAFVVLKREGQDMTNYLLEKRPYPKKFTVGELDTIAYELNGMFLQDGGG